MQSHLDISHIRLTGRSPLSRFFIAAVLSHLLILYIRLVGCSSHPVLPLSCRRALANTTHILVTSLPHRRCLLAPLSTFARTMTLLHIQSHHYCGLCLIVSLPPCACTMIILHILVTRYADAKFSGHRIQLLSPAIVHVVRSPRCSLLRVHFQLK